MVDLAAMGSGSLHGREMERALLDALNAAVRGGGSRTLVIRGRVLNNVAHWGFGLATGGAYGLLVGSRKPSVWYGLPGAPTPLEED